MEEKLQNTKNETDFDKIVAREATRLQLSLERAVPLREKTGKPIVVFFHFPPVYKDFRCEPLLGPVDLSPYLGGVARVIVGGESGPDARLCRWEWVCDLWRQCADAGVAFTFKQTGAKFEKDGKVYRVPRPQQMRQAKKAAAAYFSGGTTDGL